MCISCSVTHHSFFCAHASNNYLAALVQVCKSLALMSSSLCCAVSQPSGHPSSTSMLWHIYLLESFWDEHESSGDPSKQPIWSTAIWKYCNTIWWADRELCIWKSNSNWFLWWHQTLNIWDLHQCLWHLLLNPLHSEMVMFSCEMQVFVIYVIGFL